jgi:hypothetical protein
MTIKTNETERDLYPIVDRYCDCCPEIAVHFKPHPMDGTVRVGFSLCEGCYFTICQDMRFERYGSIYD